LHWIDWLIIIPYILGMLVIGLLLRKKATASVDDYFLAGRKLPWWLIGFTNVASYTGSSAAFVLLVFQNGIVGNWLWWGIWVIWMPMMTIFWAKIWRRLRIITDAEFLELRYGGNFAKILRMTVAIYASFFFAVIGMAVVSTWLSATVAAITGISANWLIVIFAIITFIYTLLSGLLGISYTDIPQFLIYVVANVILVFFCVAAAGGWSTMY
jgi:Na+/proline symporter